MKKLLGFSIEKQIKPLITAVILAGFAWVAVKGFADYFEFLSSFWRIIIGLAGFLVTLYYLKAFKIKKIKLMP